MSLTAALSDAVAVFAGFMLATWIRFYSGWIPLRHEGLPSMEQYLWGALAATGIFLLVARWLSLYERPQLGRYVERIPRIIRATGLSMLLAAALTFFIHTEQPYSRLTAGLAFVAVTLLVMIERNILFQLERHWAKYQAEKRKVVILGTGPLAVQLQHALKGEPRLRAQLHGFLTLANEPDTIEVEEALLKGSIDQLQSILDSQSIDEVVLTNPSALPHEEIVKIMVLCEHRFAQFRMVPDLFRTLTSKVDIQSIDGVPILGMGRWPLDTFFNRVLKRLEDITGALVGLLLSAPVIFIAALLIKRSSPGPVFYGQERCGEKDSTFMLYKLRTMKIDAEVESGPVWTVEDDPRRTKIGSFLRKWNLDELPQFWNVLKGDMSVVGPRPERPHFVEQFKEDINRYMFRHSCKPGMSGWAQVNGLRGNTSLQRRIQHDLFYLENWSLALDLKIILLTFYKTENAY